MSQQQAIATKLPSDLKKALDRVCEETGLRKNFVIESALREKLEDLLDTQDLKESVQQASGFHSWKSIRSQLKIKG